MAGGSNNLKAYLFTRLEANVMSSQLGFPTCAPTQGLFLQLLALSNNMVLVFQEQVSKMNQAEKLNHFL